MGAELLEKTHSFSASPTKVKTQQLVLLKTTEIPTCKESESLLKS